MDGFNKEGQMILTLDTVKGILSIQDHSKRQFYDRVIDLYSREAFEQIYRQWIKIGWNLKYPQDMDKSDER